MDFNAYMQQRQQKAQQLIEKADKSTQSYEDNRFWKPTLDKEKGVGGAVIRFLPVLDNSTLDYVEYRNYAFQWKDTGRWYIENSLWTFKEVDPIGELRQRMYNTGQEIDKQLASSMRLNTTYVANILVVNDPAHPEYNGKIMLYKYNKTIQGLIDTALKPEADPLTGKVEDSMNAFDLVNGANLEIRISQGKNGWDYEKTKWAHPSAIVKSEEDFTKIASQLYNLSEFIDRSKYKSYDELGKRLAYVINEDFIGSGVKVLTNGSVKNFVQEAQAKQQSQEQPRKPEASKPSDASTFVDALVPESKDYEPYTPPWEVETSDADDAWMKDFDLT